MCVRVLLKQNNKYRRFAQYKIRFHKFIIVAVSIHCNLFSHTFLLMSVFIHVCVVLHFEQNKITQV